MAQEAPLNPNTGGTGNQSSSYSEIRAPQFVGGNTDPNTGNIIPASSSTAAVAPPPQQPTTLLANVDVPTAKSPNLAKQIGSAAVDVAAPYLGAQIGSQVGAGTGLGDATSNTFNSLGSAIGGGAKTLSSGIQAATDSAGDLVSSAPTASSATSSLTDLAGSSTLGGAAGFGIGAGIGTAVGGALSGEKPSQYIVPAAESAGGGAVGFAIGSAILPGVGSLIGGALGSLFCHVAGTLVRMEDGSLKPVEQLKCNDRVFLGGEVIGRGEIWVTNLFCYRGVIVNGQHAVFEDGGWLRVKDAATAVRVDVPKCAVAYPIVTEHHLMVLETHIAADVAEVDEDTGHVARLAAINANADRNRRLVAVERRLAEKLSVDDLATMQAYVIDGDRVHSGGRNNNIFPDSVCTEMAAAGPMYPVSR